MLTSRQALPFSWHYEKPASSLLVSNSGKVSVLCQHLAHFLFMEASQTIEQICAEGM